MHRHALVLPILTAAAFAQSQVPFDAAVVVAPEDVRFVKTLDLDGDGWMDAIGALHNSFTGSVQNYHLVGYLNDQTGKLVRAWSLDVPIYSQHLSPFFDQHDAWAVGDLDADGDQDFVVSTGVGLFAFRANGALPPTQAATALDPANEFRSVALADFDGDGDLDVANTRGWTTIELRSIDFGAGTLPIVSSLAAGSTTRGRLVAGEFTGDTTPDLFAYSELIVPVVAGQLTTPIALPPMFPSGTLFDARNDAGDIDGDGDVDLITFYKLPTTGDPHGYRVLRRVSPTQFVAEPVTSSGGPARILVDVDGDGDLDAVCCGGGSSPIPENNIASTLRIAFNDGQGNFAESIQIPALGSTAIGGVADLDHDGDVDFVAGRCVYWQQRPISGPMVAVVGTNQQNGRTMADLDGDGDVDFEPLPWSFRRNRGNGELVLDPVAIPAVPPGLAHTGQGHLGDWDGDGDLDRLMLTTGPGGIVGFDLLVNQGSGVFTGGGIVSGPTMLASFPFMIADGLAADVDSDHDQDLVLRTYSGFWAGGLRSGWLRNDGPSGFTYQATFASFVVSRVVDVDGDGLVDLLGSRYASNELTVVDLSWARGLGGGAFAPLAYLHSSEIYSAADSADLDGDGDLDFVGVPLGPPSSATQARVLWNQGNATFTVELLPVELLASPTWPASAHVLDVDCDGRLDIVVAPLRWGANTSVIHLRRADGTGWRVPIVQVLEGSSFSGVDSRTTSADIDGDGDRDFIARDRCFENLHFDATAGSRLQIDGGNPGSGGITPTIGAAGPFRVGEPVRIVMRGLKPLRRTYLVANTSSTLPPPILPGMGIPRPTTDVRVLRFLASGSVNGPAGSGKAELAFTVPSYLAGSTRTYTALVEDPGAHGGLAISNRLVIAYGP